MPHRRWAERVDDELARRGVPAGYRRRLLAELRDHAADITEEEGMAMRSEDVLGARLGDPVALAVIDEGMRALAAGIATTATELDVTTFVLGGGVSRAGDVIFDPLRRHLADFAVLPYVLDLEVRPAVLENAGLLGAAALALRLG